MDVDRLSAGVELDILVADKVMGWPLLEEGALRPQTDFVQMVIEPTPLSGKQFVLTHWRWDGKGHVWSRFNPSVSLGAAMGVVAKILARESKPNFFLEFVEESWRCHFGRSRPWIEQPPYAPHAETAPLAICRATLREVTG